VLQRLSSDDDSDCNEVILLSRESASRALEKGMIDDEGAWFYHSYINFGLESTLQSSDDGFVHLRRLQPLEAGQQTLLDLVATGPVIRWEPFLHQDSAQSRLLTGYSGQEQEKSKVAYGLEWGIGSTA